MQGRTTAERGREGKRSPETESRPRAVRRVVFRTDAPRRSPAPPKPAESQIALVRPRRQIPQPVPRAAPEPPTSPNPTLPRGLALQPTTFTPYDQYLGSVRAVIAHLDARSATMPTACELLREGHGFHYRMTDPYRAQPPAVTDERRAGDCKSKALWLYDQLGDGGAFYTIGKLWRGSRTSHAWVYWRYDGRWWILDPTDRATPIAADSVSSSRYVPYYSYSRSGTFRHPATSLMLAMGNGIPATSAVAVRARFDGGKGTTQARR